MTQQEYEKAKAECWEEFKKENLDGEVQWQPVSRYDVFCEAFDRAYALGKQTEAISQEDVEKAAEAFSTPPMGNGGLFTREQVKELLVKFARIFVGKQEKDAEEREVFTCEKSKVLYHFRMAEACKTGNNPESEYWIGYSKAIQELFGFKGEPCVEPKDAENAVIQGWISRNKRSKWSSPELRIFYGKPQKIDELGKWVGIRLIENIDCTLFPDLTWESDPQKVEIIIKRKKK